MFRLLTAPQHLIVLLGWGACAVSFTVAAVKLGGNLSSPYSSIASDLRPLESTFHQNRASSIGLFPEIEHEEIP